MITSPTTADDSKAIDVLWLIDDDPFNSFLASSLLKKNLSVNRVEVFHYALDALSALQNLYHSGQSLPDVILLDIYMPMMDGFEFLTEVKNQHIDLTRTKIFLHTGSVDVVDREKARKTPFPIAGYLIKPLDKTQIDLIWQESGEVYYYF